MDDQAGELDGILHATDERFRTAAWKQFVERYSALILKVCRAMGGDYDAAMDRYAFVLDELRAHDFRRLRTFVADGRSKLSTWLVVVTRRLCLDHHRHRYGRTRAAGSDAERSARRSRRDLVDLVSQHVVLDDLATPESDPTELLEESERQVALRGALAELDPGDRLLLRMRFDDELSVPEIARLLNFPSPFHVYRRLKHLLQVMRKALQRAGIETTSS